MIILAMKYLVRRPRHTLAIIITISIVISLIFGMFLTIDSLKYIALRSKLENLAADYMAQGSYENYTIIKQSFLEVEGVNDVLVYLDLHFRGLFFKKVSYITQFESELQSMSLFGIENNAFLISDIKSDIRLIEGSLNITDGIIIDKSIAEAYSLSAGDRIILRVCLYYDCSMFCDFNLTIAGIIETTTRFKCLFDVFHYYFYCKRGSYITPLKYQIFWNINDTRTLIDVYNGKKNVDIPLNYSYRIFTDRKNLISPWDLDATKQNFEQITTELKSVAEEYDLELYSCIERALLDAEIWSQDTKSIYGIFSTPVFLLGTFLITTVAYLTFEERKREYGLLKARGAENSHLIKTMVYEGLMIGIITGVLGILFGILVYNYLILALIKKWYVYANPPIIATNVPVIDVIVSICMSIGYSLFYACIPIRPINRISPLEGTAKYLPETKHEEWKPKWTLVGLIVSSVKIIEWIMLFDPYSLYSIRIFRSFLFSMLLDIYIFVDVWILSLTAPIIFPYCLTKIITMKIHKTSRFFETMLRPFSGRIIALSMRNISRKASRYSRISFILALTITFGMVMIMNNASIKDFEIREIQGKCGADINIALSSNNWTIYQNFTQISGVKNISILARCEASTNIENSIFYFTDPLSYYYVTKQYFKDEFIDEIGIKEAMELLHKKNNTILVQRHFLEDYGKNLGDNITITFMAGKTSIEVTFEIIGVINFIPGCYNYMYDFAMHYGENYYTYFEKTVFFANIVHLKNYSLDTNFKTNFIGLVDVEDNANATHIKEIIVDRYCRYVNRISVSQEDIKKRFTNIDRFSVILLFSDIQYIFALIIAAIGLGLVQMIAVIERKREIGILISRGISQFQLVKYLFNEGIVVIIIALIAGIITSYATYIGFMFTLGYPGTIILPIQIHQIVPLETYIFMGIALISSIIAMLLPAYKATKIKPSEVLKII